MGVKSIQQDFAILITRYLKVGLGDLYVLCIGMCKVPLASVGTITSGMTMLERNDRVLDRGE
jgi:hypothetical protein